MSTFGPDFYNTGSGSDNSDADSPDVDSPDVDSPDVDSSDADNSDVGSSGFDRSSFGGTSFGGTSFGGTSFGSDSPDVDNSDADSAGADSTISGTYSLAGSSIAGRRNAVGRTSPAGDRASGPATGTRTSTHYGIPYGNPYRDSAGTPYTAGAPYSTSTADTSAPAAAPAAAPAPARRKSVGVLALMLVAIVGAIAGAISAGFVVFAFDDDPEPAIASGVQVGIVSDNSASNTFSSGTDASQSASPSLANESGFIDVKAVYDDIKDSVVRVEAVLDGGADGARGSGFVLSSDGHIVTNAHVVDLSVTGNPADFDEDQVEIIVRLSDGSDWEATVLGLDVGRDLAVLSIDAEGLVPAKLGQTDDVEVGDPVIAVGNALSLGDTPTVTTGIVSAVDRSVDLEVTRLSRLIQTDAAINPGNSGGPLLNKYGEVIGINTAIAGLEYDGLGFAIAVEHALNVIESLEEGVVPETAFLGVRVVPAERWDFVLENDVEGEHDDIVDLVVPDVEGAIVIEVLDGTAAQRAGIKAGDIIVEFDGTKISDNLDLVDVIKSLLPGSDIDARVVRKSDSGNQLNLRFLITLGEV